MAIIELSKEESRYLLGAVINNHASVDPNEDPFQSMQRRIIGKLISKCESLMDEFDDMQDSRYHTANEFNEKALFCGGGSYSQNRISILHKRLSYAIMLLSGLQQNGGQGTKVNEARKQADISGIKEALQDITNAFDFES